MSRAGHWTTSCTRCTIGGMVTTTLSNFRAHQSELLDAAQRAPVEILSRGSRRRAVVVSPEFFDRALQALEDQADVEAAAAARREDDSISHEDLMAELGL
jgi:antitoxin StbD